MNRFGMNVFYISHPYTGDEDKNRAKAIYLAAKLAAKYPQIVFINPLAAMYHTMTAELDYDTVMTQCKELIRRSDGVIMMGNWQESKGCNMEFDFAVKNRKFVWNGADEFEKAMVDEFGYDEATTERGE